MLDKIHYESTTNPSFIRYTKITMLASNTRNANTNSSVSSFLN